MNWILWAVLGCAALVAAILLFAGSSRRRHVAMRAAAAKNAGDSTTIYTSGVFSLIRKSPRAAAVARTPEIEAVRSALTAAGGAPASAETYREHWVKAAELCIHNVEQGDTEGIQTYRYEIPEKCRATCGKFGGDAYVTRDQLHHQVQLIPPFHLGCDCVIRARGAWEGGPGGWSPILPVNGQYDAPDWRTVVPL